MTLVGGTQDRRGLGLFKTKEGFLEKPGWRRPEVRKRRGSRAGSGSGGGRLGAEGDSGAYLGQTEAEVEPNSETRVEGRREG